MSQSKVTSKYQATVPQDVRTALGIKAGDTIVFEVGDDKKVIIRKASPLDIAYLKSLSSTLQEWSSPNDEEDYRDL